MTEIVDHSERSRFELPAEGGGVAIVSYDLGPGTIAFTHVIVPIHARGHGVAGRLTAAAIQSAAERGLKIIPACPFVKDWFEHHPELANLLA